MPPGTFRAQLADLDFYQRSVACQNACPVRTDARAYVNCIARGEYERAYLIARETNPFASTCGWVCGAPCEAACRRGAIDAPIAIRALKRFVNDRYGVYLGEHAEPRVPPAWRGYGGPGTPYELGNSTLPQGRASLRSRAQGPGTDRQRVAIVGAGPAGLSCAHDLALMGHEVTLFEATAVAGGMLRLGVPEYRLPRELIDLEIEAILSLGPKVHYEQAIGRDFSLADLKADFAAVFLAIGSYRSRQLNVEGEHQDGVLQAVDFLLNVNLSGYNLDLGRRVIVIGGGNVAMDVARTAARLGQAAEAGGDLELALDVARAARRLGATQEVTCLVVEGVDEMLADELEIEEAQKEGIEILNHLAPVRILGQEGIASAVQTLDVVRAFDDQGRFNPQLSPGTERDWACDSVIVAIGQVGELEWVQQGDQLEVTPRGTLAVDPPTLMTTADGVFAGGDIAFGPRLIINAVSDGQRAAAGIDAFLRGSAVSKRRRGRFTPVSLSNYPERGPQAGYLRRPRREPPTLSVDRRIGLSLVEIGFDDDQAREQASRCLICSINPIFDSELCILCNGCVDVCPMDCLKLVPMDQVSLEEGQSSPEAAEGATAMLFDPTLCIRCGLCAARCPTGAVVMNQFQFEEQWSYEEADR